MKSAITTLCLAALMLSGCASAPTYLVTVDAFSGESSGMNAYILVPGNKNTTADDLEFKEYASYVRRALAKQGFVAAESEDKANVAILLAYGISAPHEHRTLSQFGSMIRLETEYTYARFVILDAVDFNEYRRSKKLVELWKTVVKSSGENGDLRKALPVLVAASVDYIGKNTHGKVDVTLCDCDKDVLEIEGIAPPEKLKKGFASPGVPRDNLQP